MYPSGETNSVGVGNQTIVKPSDASFEAISLSSMFHLPDL